MAPVILLLGGDAAIVFNARNRRRDEVAGLTAEEKEALEVILQDREGVCRARL